MEAFVAVSVRAAEGIAHGAAEQAPDGLLPGSFTTPL
jgi:hypothetical protein